MCEREDILEGFMHTEGCCQCAGHRDDFDCDCVKKKMARDGTEEGYMSASFLNFDDTFKTIMETTVDAIIALKEKSFFCECPPVEGN